MNLHRVRNTQGLQRILKVAARDSVPAPLKMGTAPCAQLGLSLVRCFRYNNGWLLSCCSRPVWPLLCKTRHRLIWRFSSRADVLNYDRAKVILLTSNFLEPIYSGTVQICFAIFAKRTWPRST